MSQRDPSTMSAPTTHMPAVARSHSTSSRPSRAPADLPHRTRSVAVRSSNASQPPTPTHLSHSKTPSQDRRPPSNYGAIDNVARRDPETSNVARMPSRREASADRSQERPSTARTESARRHQRNPSSQSRQRDSVDMTSSSTAQEPPQHATGTSAAAAAPRRRTTITTPTGNWALGKTIGAGSMGKVKLAKNLGSGEQVWMIKPEYFLPLKSNTHYGRRLPLKLCHDSRLRNIAPPGRQRELIAPRKFERLGKLPSSAW